MEDLAARSNDYTHEGSVNPHDRCGERYSPGRRAQTVQTSSSTIGRRLLETKNMAVGANADRGASRCVGGARLL